MDFPLLPPADKTGRTPKETTALAPEMAQAEGSFLALVDTSAVAPETELDASDLSLSRPPRLAALSDPATEFTTLPANSDVIASPDAKSPAIPVSDVPPDAALQLQVNTLAERKSEVPVGLAAIPQTDASSAKSSSASALPLVEGGFTKTETAKRATVSEVAKPSPQGLSAKEPASPTTALSAIEDARPVETSAELPAPSKPPSKSDQTASQGDASRTTEPLADAPKSAADQKPVDPPAPLVLRETRPNELPPTSVQKASAAQMPTAESPSRPATATQADVATKTATSDIVSKAAATTPRVAQAPTDLIPSQFTEGLPRSTSPIETPTPRTRAVPAASISLPARSSQAEVVGQDGANAAKVVQTTASAKTDVSAAPPAPIQPAQPVTAAPQMATPAPQVTAPPVPQATAPMTVTVAQMRSGELAEPARKAPEVAKTTATPSTATPVPAVASDKIATGLSVVKSEASLALGADIIPFARDGLTPTGPNGPAGAPPTLQPNAPGLPPQVMAQLAEMAPSLRNGPVEIQLSPEELGRVRLALSTTDTSVQIQIMAERPETQDLIRRNIDILAEDLKRQGFTDVGFSFGDSSDRADHGRDRDNSGGFMSSGTENTPDTPVIKQTLTIAPSARLDIRL